MLFSLGLLVLLLAITFFQSTHGFFSALIMTVLTICCAAAAVGSYEWVAINWLAPYWQRDYAAAIALAATFAVPLLLLRVAADQLIKRSCLLPSWVDRVGGGVCGLVTALILVGILAASLQMIPFDNGSIVGYSRVAIHPREKVDDGPDPTPPKPEAEDSELLLKQDRFAVALAAILSDGIFSGKRSFAAENPNFMEGVGWLNAAPRGVSRYAPPKSISIVETEVVPFVYKHTPPPARSNDPPHFEPIKPRAHQVFQMIRVKLLPDRTTTGRDRFHTSTFTLRQFRLVGRKAGAEGYMQLFPTAIQQPVDDATNRHIKLEVNGRWGDWPVTEVAYQPREGNNGEVEIVFELPEGFQPSYLEYKRGARVAVSFGEGDSDASRPQVRRRRSQPESTTSTQPDQDETSASASSESDSPSGRGGNIRRFVSRPGQSVFSDRIPIPLKAYRRLKNAEIRRGALVDGHLVGFVDEQESGQDREVSRLRVPSEQRLLQLNSEFLEARSTLGRAVTTAVRTIQNYFVMDSQGRQYKVVGKYAEAAVAGRRVVEIQYFTSPVGSMGGLGRFDMIQDEHLKNDYKFVLLFLVDPGVHITMFSTGGSATRQEDLFDQNLIAPD